MKVRHCLVLLPLLRRHEHARRHRRRRRRVVDDVTRVAHDRRLLLGRRDAAELADQVDAVRDLERALSGRVERSQRRVVAVVAVQQRRQWTRVARAVAARQSGQPVGEPDLFVGDLLPDLAGLRVAGDDPLEVADVDASGRVGRREEVEVGVVAERRSLLRLVVVFRRLGRDTEVVPAGNLSRLVSPRHEQ